MNISYKVDSTSYDETTDSLIAVVSRADGEQIETYKITAEFSFIRYSIRDCSNMPMGDCSPEYPSQILVAFMKAFNANNSGGDSPAHVDLTDFTVIAD